MKFLIWGGKGWIGSMICDLLRFKGYTVILATARLDNYPAILSEIKSENPDFVINSAGITGVPNVDWCENNKQATIFTNVIGTINLAMACSIESVHMTNFASGCIYTYDKIGKELIYRKFLETDEPTFYKSTYSFSKAMAQKLLDFYPNVLTLRLRMPITYDLNPKSFLTKITKYAKVINIPNSMTILPQLLPIALEMTLQKITGIYNFTNPGAISHNEVLTLYRDYVDSTFTWTNFTVEEQDTILKAPRSNCELDTTKIQEFCRTNNIELPEVKNAMILVMREIKKDK